MRPRKDPYPPTPRSFHSRVEETLCGLEENNMKDGKSIRFSRYNVRVMVAAVIAVILLTATAMAAVIGSNALKEMLSASGAEEFVHQVQDIHTQDAAEGFGLSIDEAVWEGEKLFVSYTVTVPEEGGPWLVGIYTPNLNGEKMGYSQGWFLDEPDWPTVIVMGGGQSKRTEVHEMYLPEGWKAADVQELAIGAVFMKAALPIGELPDDYDEITRTVENIAGQERRILNGSEYLMSETWAGSDTVTYIDLSMHPEVYALFEEKLSKCIEETGFDPAESKNVFTFSPEGFWATEDCWDKVNKAHTLTAEELTDIGLADIVCERMVTTRLDVEGVHETVYNAVSESLHQMDGYSVEVDRVMLSHFGYRFEFIIRKDGGFDEREVERFSQGRIHDIEKLYFYTVMTPDGNDLVTDGHTCTMHLEQDLSGQYAVRVTVSAEGIIDLENIDQLLLVPYDGEEGYVPYLLDEAITVTPVIAEASINPGAVWCNVNGTYYHLEKYCSGMITAQETTVEEAEKLGKLPCPVCR